MYSYLQQKQIGICNTDRQKLGRDLEKAHKNDRNE